MKETLTLGEINNHVLSITDNLPGFTGTQPGSTNIKDLIDTKAYGRRIMQHAGSIPLATFLLTHPNANFYTSAKYVSKEYAKFKNSFIKAIDSSPDGTIRDKVDAIIKIVSANKSEEFPFYHSDMVGWSENFTKILNERGITNEPKGKSNTYFYKEMEIRTARDIVKTIKEIIIINKHTDGNVSVIIKNIDAKNAYFGDSFKIN